MTLTKPIPTPPRKRSRTRSAPEPAPDPDPEPAPEPDLPEPAPEPDLLRSRTRSPLLLLTLPRIQQSPDIIPTRPQRFHRVEMMQQESPSIRHRQVLHFQSANTIGGAECGVL